MLPLMSPGRCDTIRGPGLGLVTDDQSMLTVGTADGGCDGGLTACEGAGGGA